MCVFIILRIIKADNFWEQWDWRLLQKKRIYLYNCFNTKILFGSKWFRDHEVLIQIYVATVLASSSFSLMFKIYIKKWITKSMYIIYKTLTLNIYTHTHTQYLSIMKLSTFYSNWNTTRARHRCYMIYIFTNVFKLTCDYIINYNKYNYAILNCWSCDTNSRKPISVAEKRLTMK